MKIRIGCKWIHIGLLALITMTMQTAWADSHASAFGDHLSGAGRPLDQDRNSSVVFRPRRYIARQRLPAQDSKITAVIRGYNGFLPLQGRQRTSVLAEDGSVLGAFCSVYEGQCPVSRRFSFPAGSASQFILQTEVTTQHYRELANHYGLDLALGAGRYQGTSDQQHATTIKMQVGLSTPAIHPLQHSLFFHSTDVSSTGRGDSQTASVRTAALGFRQRLRLPTEVSSVLFGADDLVWEVARGHSRRESGTTDQTHIHLAQHWNHGIYFLKVSADWRSYQPPADSLFGQHDQHTQMIETGLSAATSSAFGALLDYVHIRSVRISHARTRTRFSRPLLWQAAPKDRTESQTSILISADYLRPNIVPFLLLQEQAIHQSALTLPGRHYLVSLGVAIQF